MGSDHTTQKIVGWTKSKKETRTDIDNVQINTKKHKPLSQQDIMRRLQFYHLVDRSMEATGNFIAIVQLLNLGDNKWCVILFPLQVKGGKLKMELARKYAVPVISQQDNQRPLKTTKLWKTSVILKHVSLTGALLYWR